MPQVPLNRLYKIRSTARTPVSASTHIPDAAGAYLRGVLPGQRAALQIAGENAKLAADKARSRVEGIATGLQAFGDTYQAMERARERQKAIDLKKAQNDFQMAWLGARQGILDTPYDRTKTDKDGKTKATGPGTASREWLEAYDKSKIPESVRKEFDEWFAFRSAEINAEADAAHEKLRRVDAQATLATEMATAEQKVGQYLDLDNLAEYGKATEEAIATAQNQFLIAIRARDIDGKALRDTANGKPDGIPVMTDQEQAAYDSIARDMQDKYNVKRLEHLSNVLASIDDPDDPRIAEITAHLKAWGMTAEEYKAQTDVDTAFPPETETELRDDASRQHVRALLADSTAKNRRRIEGADMERAAAAQTAFNAAVGEARDALAGDDIGSVTNAWSILQAGAAQAEAHAAGIRDETRRANFLAEVRKSVESARAAYGNDLLLRVGLGTLDANQQEVARASTAALYDDAPEGMRLKALDDMDLAIATKQGDSFAREFLAAQSAGNEGRVEKMLQEFRALPDGKKKDLIGKMLFGGTSRGGTAGNAPPKKFTTKDVAYLLSNGENPAEVLKQIDHAYWDRVLNAEGYLESIALVKERMTFAHAVGDKVPEYTKAVTDAMNAWLGFNSYGHTPELDSDGNPVWVATTGKTYNTTIKNDGTRATGLEYLPQRHGGTGTLPKTITVSDETLASAFKYGLQYVIRRANGLVEGKKDSAMTPEAVMQELQAEFDEFLLGDEAIANDILRNRIERARMRRMPWNERRIAGARQAAIAERSYH